MPKNSLQGLQSRLARKYGDGPSTSSCPNVRRFSSDLTCLEYQLLPIDLRAPEDVALAVLAKKERWRRCPKVCFVLFSRRVYSDSLFDRQCGVMVELQVNSLSFFPDTWLFLTAFINSVRLQVSVSCVYRGTFAHTYVCSLTFSHIT